MTFGIIESFAGRIHRVDPYAWLKETLERLAQGWPINQIDGLMPWNFKA